MPNNKKSASVNELQATVTETVQRVKVKLINDPAQIQLAHDGLLELDGKKILIVRGGDSGLAISQVYLAFLNKQDDTGTPFAFSKRLRGLTHVDKIWNSPKRLTGPEFLSYMSRWFTPVQRITNVNGDALVIMPEIPALFGALCQQSRFSGMFGGMFPWID